MSAYPMLLAAFTYGALLGPVFAAAFQATLRQGRRGGAAVFAGSWASDLLLAVAGYYSAAGWTLGPWAWGALGWAGAGLLVLLGAGLMRRKKPLSSPEPEKKQRFGPFLAGFSLNSLNPANLAFWCALAISLPSPERRAGGLALSLAILLLCNGLKWLLALRLQHRMRPDWLPRITRLTGFFLLVCGIAALIGHMTRS